MKRAFLHLAFFLAFAVSAFAQIETQPLYQYTNACHCGWLFTTSPSLPAGLDGGWTRERIAAHVPVKESADTRPIYSLVKQDDLGTRYAYTKSSVESGGGWQRQEAVAFYVANTKLPGTTALYRLYLPLRVEGDTSPGGFSARVTGTDTTFYTTDPAEKSKALQNGWVSQGSLGYVWTSPQYLPDLTVQKTDATESSVTVVVRNAGKVNTMSALYRARLTVLDRDGNVVKTFEANGPGLSPGQTQPLVFQTGATTLTKRKYRVDLDPANVLAESNDNNNSSGEHDGPTPKIKIENQGPSGPPKPSIWIRQTKPQVGSRVLYPIEVANTASYPAEWFVNGGSALPSDPCGPGRMYARIFVRSGGTLREGGCESLSSRSALEIVNLVVPKALTDQDSIQLVLEDRLLKQSYTSDPFSAGWVGVSDLLFSAGCKTFLGRASSFLCNPKGLQACENLRSAGKPIVCTPAPQKK